jgi:hypothetical protein
MCPLRVILSTQRSSIPTTNGFLKSLTSLSNLLGVPCQGCILTQSFLGTSRITEVGIQITLNTTSPTVWFHTRRTSKITGSQRVEETTMVRGCVSTQ